MSDQYSCKKRFWEFCPKTVFLPYLLSGRLTYSDSTFSITVPSVQIRSRL